MHVVEIKISSFIPFKTIVNIWSALTSYLATSKSRSLGTLLQAPPSSCYTLVLPAILRAQLTAEPPVLASGAWASCTTPDALCLEQVGRLGQSMGPRSRKKQHNFVFQLNIIFLTLSLPPPLTTLARHVEENSVQTGDLSVMLKTLSPRQFTTVSQWSSSSLASGWAHRVEEG